MIYYIPVYPCQWENETQFLVKFRKLSVGSEQVRWLSLPFSLNFQNIHIIFIGIVSLLITIQSHLMNLAILYFPETQ